MFHKRKFIHHGRIDSDEGFAVDYGRDTVIYHESGRKMSITVDIGANQANIFTESIARWDDAPLHSIDIAARQRIAQNVKRALEWDGLTVHLLS